jgi:hypothetical protein
MVGKKINGFQGGNFYSLGGKKIKKCHFHFFDGFSHCFFRILFWGFYCNISFLKFFVFFSHRRNGRGGRWDLILFSATITTTTNHKANEERVLGHTFARRAVDRLHGCGGEGSKKEGAIKNNSINKL